MTSDPQHWFAGERRLLFVHAHPDDETIATGGTLAGLASAGMQPCVVTLTRGERGEIVPESRSGVTGPLPEHREGELAAALACLGVDEHLILGVVDGERERTYEDSGMAWGSDGRAIADADTGLDALTRVPAVQPITDLLHVAEAWGVTGLVSYDAGGGYGHPDHVFAHRAARAAAHGLELAFWEIVPDGASGPEVEAYDVSSWFDLKRDALREHRTQLTVDGEEIVHVGGQREAITRVERYRQRPGLG